MNLKTQGLVFSVLALAALLAAPLFPRLDTQVQLLVLAPVILLLGVPHGALDIVFARQFLGIQSTPGWGLFSLAYMAAAAAVVGFWWIAPGFFLAAFLLISVFHFSGDPDGDTSVLFRTLYGGSIILCPLGLHAREVSEVFAYLAGAHAADMIVGALTWAAWPWLAVIFLTALAGARQEPLRSAELLAVAALLTFAPPLPAFTFFFCGMHSARHVLRTRDYSREGTLLSLLRLATLPLAITLVGVVLAWWLLGESPVNVRLTQLLFVGLAALTVPHMIVVEQVRLTGWVAGRNIWR